jgi:hypothetical protein
MTTTSLAPLERLSEDVRLGEAFFPEVDKEKVLTALEKTPPRRCLSLKHRSYQPTMLATFDLAT